MSSIAIFIILANSWGVALFSSFIRSGSFGFGFSISNTPVDLSRMEVPDDCDDSVLKRLCSEKYWDTAILFSGAIMESSHSRRKKAIIAVTKSA